MVVEGSAADPLRHPLLDDAVRDEQSGLHVADGGQSGGGGGGTGVG